MSKNTLISLILNLKGWCFAAKEKLTDFLL
jgi:hypothetical protein